MRNLITNNTPTRRAIRKYLLIRDEVCRYCGESGFDIEHVNPRARGGQDNVFTNLVLACSLCNTRKGREQGFELEDNRLTWHGQLVAPDALFGAELMALVEAQRLDRQRKQGLTHLVEHKEAEMECSVQSSR